jgi:hypothetical protein
MRKHAIHAWQNAGADTVERAVGSPDKRTRAASPVKRDVVIVLTIELARRVDHRNAAITETAQTRHEPGTRRV